MKSILLILFMSVSGALSAQEAQFTFVFLNTRTDKTELPKEEVDELMKGHLANIQRLAREGKLLMAGPFDGGGGIFIFNSTSTDTVKQWLATDPGIQANRWRLEIFPYIPRVGSACAVSPDTEMVNYTFIRYISTITKFNVQKAGETFKKHDDYLKKIIDTGNVVTEGIFPNRDGGILVMKGQVDKALIEADPSMTDAVFTIEFKKIWVAKGSFCEES
ncbi:MAG: YciI family protein [Cyclobacteriaceae bacterium]